MGGGTPSKSNKEYWNGKIPWCSVKDLGDDLIISSTKNTITSDGLNNSASRIAEVSDLIYCSRIRVGAVRIPAIPMAINQDLKIIKLPNSVNQEYIALALSNYPINTSGTTVFGTSLEDIKNIVIPLPPIKEQNRIVKKYKDCIYLINQIRADSDSLFDLVGFAKNKILESIFCCDSSYKSYYGSRTFTTLNKLIPSDKIGDGDWVLSENMDENGEYRIVQLKHIGKGCYVNKPYKRINKNFFENNSCSEIKPNFLLINRLVSEEMDACLLPSFSYKTITSVDVCWIAPDEKYDQKYLMYYLLSPAFQSQVLLKSSGSTRKRISKKNLISIPIQIHNLDDQKMIVKDIEQYFELLNSIIE